jgi:hypothetical protein
VTGALQTPTGRMVFARCERGADKASPEKGAARAAARTEPQPAADITAAADPSVAQTTAGAASDRATSLSPVPPPSSPAQPTSDRPAGSGKGSDRGASAPGSRRERRGSGG